MTSALTAAVPDGHVRLDGSLETRRGELFVPLMTTTPSKKSKVDVIGSYPEKGIPDFIFFSNGWCYLRVIKKGQCCTVALPAVLDEKLRARIFAGKLPADLIVPDNFVLPKSLKSIVGETTIATVDDATYSRADFGQNIKPTKKTATGRGFIFITSPHTGKIAMLDETSLNKLNEFPTEGTPAGMAFAEGRLYIADQAKNKILTLDPTRKQFLAAIELPNKSAPKGLAALPNGKLLYCSESATGNIDVIEPATGRILLKTKVPTGPGRLAITPNGFTLVVLNVPTGQVTLVSTMNQRVIATIAVGAMPNNMALSKDSEIAYISNRMSNTVSIIDIPKKAVMNTLKTGLGPTGLALSKDESRLFVANAKDSTISVFDLKKQQKLQDIKLPLDVDFPGTMMLMPDGKHIAVSSESTQAIGLLSVSSLSFEKQPDIGNTSDELIWVPEE